MGPRPIPDAAWLARIEASHDCTVRHRRGKPARRRGDCRERHRRGRRAVAAVGLVGQPLDVPGRVRPRPEHHQPVLRRADEAPRPGAGGAAGLPRGRQDDRPERGRERALPSGAGAGRRDGLGGHLRARRAPHAGPNRCAARDCRLRAVSNTHLLLGDRQAILDRRAGDDDPAVCRSARARVDVCRRADGARRGRRPRDRLLASCRVRPRDDRRLARHEGGARLASCGRRHRGNRRRVRASRSRSSTS